MAQKQIPLIPPSLVKKTKQAHLIHYLFTDNVLVLSYTHSSDPVHV